VPGNGLASSVTLFLASGLGVRSLERVRPLFSPFGLGVVRFGDGERDLNSHQELCNCMHKLLSTHAPPGLLLAPSSLPVSFGKSVDYSLDADLVT
jgi:hypothetical protein